MSSENRLKLRLELDVEYNLDGEDPEELKAKLGDIVKHATGDGWLTGDGPATVEHHHYEVIDLTDRERAVEQLEAMCEAAGVEPIDFDDLVHDLASQPASDTNNAGLPGQFDFIIGQVGFDSAKILVEREIRKKKGDDDGS